MEKSQNKEKIRVYCSPGRKVNRIPEGKLRYLKWSIQDHEELIYFCHSSNSSKFANKA